MTTDKKIARRKLSLLDLASELSNVSRACKVMVYSKQQFYEIRRNFQTYGADGLIDRLSGAQGPHPGCQPRPKPPSLTMPWITPVMVQHGWNRNCG